MKQGRAGGGPQKTGRRRWGRAQLEALQDPYKARVKPAEPSACSQCGAVFRKGRWSWPELPTTAAPTLCPACHRENDKFPAGTLTLRGAYISAHGDDMLNLVRHQAELEKKEHPLHRVMAIAREADKIVVTTTDIHLPKRIGQAVHRAHHGKLDIVYDEDAYNVQVTWHRED